MEKKTKQAPLIPEKKKPINSNFVPYMKSITHEQIWEIIDQKYLNPIVAYLPGYLTKVLPQKEALGFKRRIWELSNDIRKLKGIQTPKRQEYQITQEREVLTQEQIWDKIERMVTQIRVELLSYLGEVIEDIEVLHSLRKRIVLFDKAIHKAQKLALPSYRANSNYETENVT